MTMRRKVYQHIASALQAIENCRRMGNSEWISNHTETIERIIKNYLPSGSGFNNGTQLDFDASKPNRLVFNTAFHHMDEWGVYDGWTDHTVIVTPDLALDFDIRVTGRNRDDIKDYLGETYNDALSVELTEAQYSEVCGVRSSMIGG